MTHPLDIVRTRLASARLFEGEAFYQGASDCLRRTWSAAGVRGLYAGCGVSLLEIAPYTAIAFAGYEGAKQRLEHLDTSSLNSAMLKILAGLSSGASATMMCYPLDTVRRQLMLDGALGFDARYRGSVVHCLRSLWQQGGVWRFYRGLSVTLLKSVPSVAITFLSNDWLREALSSRATATFSSEPSGTLAV